MTKIVRREIRKRGFFGWLFLLIFLGFNAFMALWLVAYWVDLSQMAAATKAEQAGKAIGGTIGSTMLLSLWAVGSIITGLLALLTRGSKTIIEETVS